MFGRLGLRALWLAFVFVASALGGVAEQPKGVAVLHVMRSGKASLGAGSLEAAAAFYGVGIVRADVGSAGFRTAASKALDISSTVGIAIDAGTLEGLAGDQVLKLVTRPRQPRPILVLGVTPDTSRHLSSIVELGGNTPECKGDVSVNVVRFSNTRTLNHQLAGLELRLPGSFTCAFEMAGSSTAEPVISVRHNGNYVPVLFRTRSTVGEVFAAAEWKPPAVQTGQSTPLTAAFSATMIPLVFVRHVAGRYGWRTAASYANLTIDDPSLTNPYGFLDYGKLLTEMQAHRFHTTIGFIPWNADRAKTEVLSLFARHPEYYSLSIHGNNHDHREFGSYSYKSLADQSFNARQAIARMERFKEATGIPYDRVMIFPHGISPAPTLRALKARGFLATVNAINTPLGESSPASLISALRSTAIYENFASITRHTAEYSVSDYPHAFPVPEATIAINAFLGNPILLYGHHGMFASGIGAFNEIADFVNRTDPGVVWKGLGYIVERSYLEKARVGEDAYDILTHSPRTCFDNTDAFDKQLAVVKPEDGRPAIKSVQVNGEPVASDLGEESLRVSMTAPRGGTSCLEIRYADAVPEAMEVVKSSMRVWLLRTISDWRDLYLSRSSAGRFVIRVYYGPSRTTAMAALAFLVGSSAGIVFWRWRVRRGSNAK